MHEELSRAGWRVSRRRVERLMRAAGLRARVARIYRANPRLHRFFDQHPNRLPGGGARRPDQVWVSDITYLPVGERQWRFLAVVLDQCSRRVLAWTLGARRDARLTCRVLDAAVRRRAPARGLIFHSDRGSEYVAERLRARLAALGIRQSAARRGPEDNPHMESFFHSLKAEALHGVRFATERAVRRAIARYVRYYNHRRLHSALGYQSPIDYERCVA
jgi:transposase InsO family protein